MHKNYCRLRHFLIVALLAALFLVLSGPCNAWAETYTSEDFNYPDKFPQNGFDTWHNDLQHMDAAYFAGREVIFFTLIHTGDDGHNYESLTENLYFYTPGYDYRGQLNINNSKERNFRFTTCVWNNTLYLFYTTDITDDEYSSHAIYYRTAEVIGIDAGDNWALSFSDEHVYMNSGTPVKIILARVMNDQLYFCYESGDFFSLTKWLGNSLGESFGQTVYGYGATVFQVPDAENGYRDVMMLAYCLGNGAINYFFFDGEDTYGQNHISADGLSPRSVNLIAGTAEGYNSTNYSIQAFLAYPDKDGSDERWSRIYHREYIPSGENGDQGTWSSSWTYLSNDSKDHIHCYNEYDSDKRWNVIPSFTEEDNGNLRMSLNIWYARGTDYTMTGDNVRFRVSKYQSEQLQSGELQDTVTTNINDATVIGIIEGTPPFPINNGKLGDENTNTSVLTVGVSKTEEFSVTYNYGGSVTIAYGKKPIPNNCNWNWQLSGAYKYSQGTSTSITTATTETFRTYMDTPPGKHGWALVFQPEVKAYPYILKSWAGNALSYSGNISGDEFEMFLVQYGDDSYLRFQYYNLEDPSDNLAIFEGMKERKVTVDVAGWEDIRDEYLAVGQPFTVKELPVNADIYCTQGETTEQRYSSGDTTVDSFSPGAEITLSARYLNLTADLSFTFSADISTKTSVTDTLGFYLNIPECCDPRHEDCSSSSPCIADIFVKPVLLIPDDDDTGYGAPWISDDIRNNKKPKPWCLSYLVYPNESGNEDALQKFSINKASANLYLNRITPNRDKLSAEITLSGLVEDFSLRGCEFLDFRIGNYVISSVTNKVTHYALKGQKMVLKLEEPGNPNASIRLTLTHKPAKSLVKIEVDAHGIDLSGLAPYLTSGGESGDVPDTVPFNFIMGGKNYARDDLAADIGIYEKKIKCRLRGN